MSIKSKIEQALSTIRPALQADGGDVELVDVKDNKVYVRLKGHCQGCPSATQTLKHGVTTAVRKEVPEISEVVEVLPDGSLRSTKTAPDDPWAEQNRLPDVKLIIAVASGKGGVGKSTIAVNLALALKEAGLAVGLLDADIYGPSAPTMLGVRSVPDTPGLKILPAEVFGLKVISIGYFVPADSPMIWRGPMVMKAVEQFLHDVDWGRLDCLVVDLPPGTGDAQLTLVQKVPVDGAVIVTTPSDVALIDARRGLQMFNQVKVRVLGIVENMSYFICPHCSQRTNIFSSGGGALTADRLDVEFLGEIPLDPLIRETGDNGYPVVIAEPDSPQALVFKAFARKVWAKMIEFIPQWNLSACSKLGAVR